MRFRNKESVRGYYWNLKDCDENLALTIYQKNNVSAVVSRLLALKKINIEEINNFLNPKIKNLLKNPYHLIDMDKAVLAIYDAIINKKNICIFGDYDVDGVTSTALMTMFFKNIGIKVSNYIPDRIDDGYGLSNNVILKLNKKKIDLIITVDCGISCIDAVDLANELGIKVIITDHHISAAKIPNALAVINPNRLDEKSEYKYLAGVGVAFLLCVAINMHLKKVGYYNENNLKEPNLMNMLDLVALGTVCDVMPLIGINRAFVKQGLKIFQMRKNIGLTAISDIIGINEVNDTHHLGYVIGPRINASGRVGDVNIGNKLLCCEDKFEAKKLSEQLNSFNLKRQNIEKEILEDAIEQVEKNNLVNNPVIFVEGENWHEGVIGIIASRIKDKYNRPVIVISKENKTSGKASCRSVDKSVDIGSVIIKARENGLLLTGGGHAMAGGFTFNISKLDEIKNFINEQIKNKLDNYLINNERYADITLDISSINEKMIKDLESMGPFGVDNPKPMIILENVIILNAKKFGKSSEHARCIVTSNNVISSSKSLVVNFFRFDEKKILDILFSGKQICCDIIGNISINRWMNLNTIQFTGEDIILE